ncbi:hypothetical protein [Deinococcus cellulosilyticus]|uniref:Uncharacterized protein n=1 Tax=Deinococcus cellulosilyticus (strain DSM 18568 / NBRC 106333 / KACC 11606 / 5516J-15) TaxID=1223518 RepID=A0A511MYM3_DEIC1|nr:hypothetical protein [Deinococcus cellulosilyticus]GEM45669.1 hypothetical protein DC3_13040 [Deinococcus cellulosilyticus NBRC 106333 = KACC 11606]
MQQNLQRTFPQLEQKLSGFHLLEQSTLTPSGAPWEWMLTENPDELRLTLDVPTTEVPEHLQKYVHGERDCWLSFRENFAGATFKVYRRFHPHDPDPLQDPRFIARLVGFDGHSSPEVYYTLKGPSPALLHHVLQRSGSSHLLPLFYDEVTLLTGQDSRTFLQARKLGVSVREDVVTLYVQVHGLALSARSISQLLGETVLDQWRHSGLVLEPALAVWVFRGNHVQHALGLAPEF